MKKTILGALAILSMTATSATYAGSITGSCSIKYSHTDYSQNYPVRVYDVKNVNITASAGIRNGKWMSVGSQLYRGNYDTLLPIAVGFTQNWGPNAYAVVTDYDGITAMILCGQHIPH